MTLESLREAAPSASNEALAETLDTSAERIGILARLLKSARP